MTLCTHFSCLYKIIYLSKYCFFEVRCWIFPRPVKAAARRRGRAAAAALRSSDAESRLECRGRSFSQVQPERCGRYAAMATPGPNGGGSGMSGGVVGSASHHFHQQQSSSMQGNPLPRSQPRALVQGKMARGFPEARRKKKHKQTKKKTQTRHL